MAVAPARKEGKMKPKNLVATVAGPLFLVAAVMTASAPAAVSPRTLAGPASAYRTEPAAAKRCTNGVPDRINGHDVCIHVGGKCVAAHNAKYRARGYTCVNGRLRRVTKPSISIGDASVPEGNSGTTTLSVPVTLSAASTSTVRVDYATANGTATAGSDYTAANGTLTLPAGETTKTIPISVAGDITIEPDETFTVTLSNPVNARIARGTATETITNDDTAVPVTPGSYRGATQNGNYVFFTLTPNRTITGFRVNDLPESCDPGGEITGGIDFGKDVFPVNSAGQLVAEGSWTGSNVQGDVEWTSFYAKIIGIFSTPTSINGTIIENDELNYKGQHYRCSSGQITWSATLLG
jgi:Calx-beta domain